MKTKEIFLSASQVNAGLEFWLTSFRHLNHHQSQPDSVVATLPTHRHAQDSQGLSSKSGSPNAPEGSVIRNSVLKGALIHTNWQSTSAL
jgi:hypothetical protein